jgi:hypothetical protein
MQTGEGSPPAGGDVREERRDQRDAQRIGVGGGDDQIARIQLAARWSEQFAPVAGDTLQGMLRRFRAAFDYLDSVTHGVEPVELEPEQSDSSARFGTSAPPAAEPDPAAPAPEPQPESRSW